jgi:hypothetical protein
MDLRVNNYGVDGCSAKPCLTHAGQTRHIITNNQQPTTTKMPTMNRHSFYGASSECRQLNLDARLRKAGRNARYRPFALDNLQGPPETNGGTNAPPVPLFREVPGQSRRLAFPCLQYTHAIRRTSEKFMRPYPISVLAGGWVINGYPTYELGRRLHMQSRSC